MIADSPENTIETAFDKMSCESCGKEFSCGANVGKCWCFEVELQLETLTELQKDFRNCLCQDCLEIKRRLRTTN
jgi:hypothetical protein